MAMSVVCLRSQVRCRVSVVGRVRRVGVPQLSTFSESESPVAGVNVERKNGIQKTTTGKSIAEKIVGVCDKLFERRLPPELRSREGSSDPSRVEADIVNVAEQRIAQSILRGDFENLPGKGKPLKLEGNPHADPAEDLAYRVLAKNGFAPEWVELNKEIGLKIRRWRKELTSAWQTEMKMNPGEESECHVRRWKSDLTKLEVQLQEINVKVRRYNLLVPFGRQLTCYKLERELKALQEFDQSADTLES